MGVERWSNPLWGYNGSPGPSVLTGSYYPDRNQPSCPIISMWQSSQLRSSVANQIFYYIIFQFQAFPQLGCQVVYFPKFSIIVWLTICLDGPTYWTLTWAPTGMWPKDTIRLLAYGTWGTVKTQKSQPRWTPTLWDPREWPLQNCWCFFSICLVDANYIHLRNFPVSHSPMSNKTIWPFPIWLCSICKVLKALTRSILVPIQSD